MATDVSAEQPNVSGADPTASGLSLTTAHAAALVGYVADKGIQSESIVELCRKIARFKSVIVPLPCDMLGEYVAISKLITPITGVSLVDSANVDTIVKPVRVLTYVFLGFVLLNTMLSAWFVDLPEPEDGVLWWLLQAQRYVLDIIAPFLWGALGSCVYLLKRYSDLAEARIFDEDSMQGWGTRILLGAILGGVVQYLYDSSVFTSSGLKLDANALGFLSGIGVKVVYGAIEKTISALGEAMNLDAVRKAPTRENAVRKFLADAMAEETDADKRQVLADLLKKVEPNRSST